ncbi:hypothetical protein AB2N04_08820 [Nitratireductor sp. GISD-1A_MAKvit]
MDGDIHAAFSFQTDGVAGKQGSTGKSSETIKGTKERFTPR